ncbi:MAG: hypothetical protein ABI165_11930 [Bryobacteraceae bacterium]
MKKPVLIGVLMFAGIIAFIVYSTLSTPRRRVEVCMTFNGRIQCRIASGATQEFALRTAVSNACATISSGVTETVNCEGSTPSSVKWLGK